MPYMNHQRVAIVDAYASGALVPPILQKEGIDCLMVKSSTTIHHPGHITSYRPEDFLDIILFDGSIENTAQKLLDQQVTYIFAGSDTGSELADHLSLAISTPANKAGLVEARRNKFLMIDTLRKNKVRAAAQFCTADRSALLQWCEQTNKWPLVVKPLNSSRSRGVYRCGSESEVAIAFDQIINARNVYGEFNEQVLAQEFLFGTEYVVDTVSWNGHHRIVAIWKYLKPEEPALAMRHRGMELLPYEGDTQKQLIEYIIRALDALGVHHGASHCEVILTPEGPALVEMATRMNGGKNPVLPEVCTGYGQLSGIVETIIDPDRFLSRPPGYQLFSQGIILFLMAEKEGELKAVPGESGLKASASYHDMSIIPEHGQFVSKFPGWLMLIHEEEQVLLQDVQKVLDLEKNGLFIIE